MKDNLHSSTGDQITVLITGATGFVGSRVSAYLSSLAEYRVFGLSRSPQQASDQISWIEGDFANPEQMARVLQTVQPDVILHCAGVTPHHNVDEDAFFRINVDGGAAFLQVIASLNHNIGFINASTIAVYGSPTCSNGMVSVEDTANPQSPYARSKYRFEQILEKSGLRSLNARIANIPGGDSFLKHVLTTGEVDFYGDSPYHRDYIHPADLCRFFAAGVKYLKSGGVSETVNVGSGLGLIFPAAVDEIERQTGRIIMRHHHPTKQGDVIKIICDITHAKQVLGWIPEQVNLSDIIHYAVCH